MSKRLRRFLEAIDQHRAINLNAFLAEAQRLGLSAELVRAGIECQRLRPDRYQVAISAPALERSLRQLALGETATRVEAAGTGRSHQVSVDGSYLLRRRACEHPEVVVFDGAGNFRPASDRRNALIIENRQNFLSIEQCLASLARHFALKVGSDVDILFGAGNEISNHLHRKYLSTYTELYLLFDLDEGGLSIARKLIVGLPTVNCHFLIPDDARERLNRQVGSVNQRTLDGVVALAQDCPVLQPAARLILESRKTLEQESYLE